MRTSSFSTGKILILAILLILPTCLNAAPETDRLKILVYGATGKIGDHVVSEALERGHYVTAVSRTPLRITRQHERLFAVKGDVLDKNRVRRLATGQDVIVISVRGVVGDPNSSGKAVQLLAVENIVAVLREMSRDAPRMIHVGGAGTLEVAPGVLYADRLPKLFLSKSLEVEIEGQIEALKLLRAVEDVNWTFITPPRNFTNGKRTGEFRIGGDQLLQDKIGRSRISRADFAAALIDEAENANHVQARFSVAY